MRNQSSTYSQPSSPFGAVEQSADLMDVIAEIERRVGLLQTVERELPDEEELNRERDEQLRELAEQQSRVEERRREQGELSRQMAEQQAEIERLQSELSERQQDISNRETSVAGRAQQLEQMEASLASAKAELARQHKESKLLAEAQEREQRRLAEYKDFLAQREKELELQAEQQRKMRRELTELAAKLSEAEKQTKVSAEKGEEDRKAAEQRIKELEQRCVSLEESCQILKKKREKKQEAEPAAAAPSPQLMPAAAPVATVTAVTSVTGLVVLLATVATLAVSAFLWLTMRQAVGALWVAGASFLVPLLSCAAVKRRGVDLGLTMVAIFAGMLGLWFQPWLGVVDGALQLWQLPLEVVPSDILPQLPIASAVLTAMLALSVATGLACDDFEILFRGLLVSGATSMILLLPSSGVETVTAAVAVWVLLHTLMLIKWATPEPSSVVRTLGGNGRPTF